ncbi:MAG: hypothetical protein IPM13_14505 [Phycisphaerales bacterium]|nr:hypothetical protein [Phycisphaerales bacterium]
MRPALRADAALSARAAAAVAVADALSGKHFVHDTLRMLRDQDRLDARDAALAGEIALGTVRHTLTIEHVLGTLARFDRARTPAAVRAILCGAAYQLIWLDRIPVYAAVDEAVQLARAMISPRAASMVNAVLRRVADALGQRVVPWTRDDPAQIRTGWDRACQFKREVLPPAREADPEGHLAAAAGERPARIAALRRRYGLAVATEIAWASQATPPLVVQRNALRASAAEFRAALAALSTHVEFVGDDRAYLPAGTALLDCPAFAAGHFYVQDATAHEAAAAVEAAAGERILDLCAAPGGKSVALAISMQDSGVVVACDPDPRRLQRVVANIGRLGLTAIQARVLSPADAAAVRDEHFDAVLVDAPCSNTGVVARRPEARLGLTSRKLRSLVATQAELLARALGQVRPGGRVVYSTCSVEPEENDHLVRQVLGGASGWRIEAEHTTLPAWGPRLADWRDGGYWARLRLG